MRIAAPGGGIVDCVATFDAYWSSTLLNSAGHASTRTVVSMCVPSVHHEKRQNERAPGPASRHARYLAPKRKLVRQHATITPASQRRECRSSADCLAGREYGLARQPCNRTQGPRSVDIRCIRKVQPHRQTQSAEADFQAFLPAWKSLRVH